MTEMRSSMNSDPIFLNKNLIVCHIDTISSV